MYYLDSIGIKVHGLSLIASLCAQSSQLPWQELRIRDLVVDLVVGPSLWCHLCQSGCGIGLSMEEMVVNYYFPLKSGGKDVLNLVNGICVCVSHVCSTCIVDIRHHDSVTCVSIA